MLYTVLCTPLKPYVTERECWKTLRIHQLLAQCQKSNWGDLKEVANLSQKYTLTLMTWKRLNPIWRIASVSIWQESLHCPSNADWRRNSSFYFVLKTPKLKKNLRNFIHTGSKIICLKSFKLLKPYSKDITIVYLIFYLYRILFIHAGSEIIRCGGLFQRFWILPLN